MEEENEVLSLKDTEDTSQSIISVTHKMKIVFDTNESDSEEKVPETTETTTYKETTNNTECHTLAEDVDVIETHLIKKSKPKRLAIIDSDDSETDQTNSETDAKFSKGIETFDEITNDKFNELNIASEEIKADDRNVENQQVLKSNTVYITNNKGQLIPESDAWFEETKNKLNALCDSDTSEDENKEEFTVEKTTQLENIKSMSKGSNKKRSRNTKEKTKKMTGKEALEQRKEIFNESQKRLRNLNVAIPYHKPKCRTLKEFLSNKPKISSTVPSINTPPSVAIKLASQQLNIITEKIQEHEKVVQVFYKSDSESEDECEEQVDKTVLDNNEGKSDENDNKDEEESQAMNANEDENISSSENKIVEIEKVNETAEGLNNNEGIVEEKMNEDENRKDQTQKPDATEEENLKKSENITQRNEEINIPEEQSNLLISEEAMEIADNDGIPEMEKSQENLQIEQETNFCKENEETMNKAQQNIHVETPGAYENIDELSSKENDDPHTSETSKVENNKDLDVNTFEYDFNLDEVEIDNTEDDVFNTEGVAKDSIFDDKEERLLNNIIQNFNNVEEFKDATKNPTKLQLLKEKLNPLKQPKLSGNSDDVIIFDDDEKPLSNGITKLKGRFLNHAFAKKTHKNEVHTEVVCFDGGKLRKETVVMTVDAEDEPVVVMEKPGAKLQKLREELQSKIMKNKCEKWQTKSTPSYSNENQSKEEKKCGSDLEYDEEEEALLSDSDLLEEEEEEEEDEEEDEDKVVQKKTKKCDFVDEEAEESNDDEPEEQEEEEAECEENGDKEQPEECSENAEKEIVESKLSHSPRKLRRIVKGFADDDSDEEEKQQSEDKQHQSKDKNLNGFNAELDSTQSYDEDDVLPAYQPRTSESPIRQPNEFKDNFDFLTPVTFLTGLQSYSASKFLRESPKETAFPLLNSSQSKDDDTTTSQEQEDDEDTSQQSGGPQRKLVFDVVDPATNTETSSSQSDMENIALLCSGTFSTQPEKCTDNKVQDNNELKGMSSCPGLPQNEKDGDEDMSDCTLKSSGSTTSKIVEKVLLDKIDKETKNLNNSEFENIFISQLLDEEEMNNFKKKFESPVNDDNKSALNEDRDVKIKGGRLILDSSDEEKEDDDCEGNFKNKKKKHTMKKITFSDDESDSDEESNKDSEEIDLHDDMVEDEEEQENLNASKKNVNYDSEENEIEDDENEDDNGDEENIVPLKTSDFFENEAELSESEWGSEDEVENDELDKLEMEEGDKEKFDEVEMRRNLEKIHMRQVLDDDNREIKILQELLLEDGELHGSGRKRQFRWKDIDFLFGNESTGKENEEGEVGNQDETDSEERWRKMRYYRELFLKQKMEKGKVIEESEITLLSGSHHIMELGQKALQRSSSASQNNSQTTDLQTPKQNDSSCDEPFSLFNKRGSFLSRTDKILTRMAELTKVPTNPILGGPKNSKNFVFKQATEVICKTKVTSSSKRKLNPETPISLKKIKLSSALNVD